MTEPKTRFDSMQEAVDYLKSLLADLVRGDASGRASWPMENWSTVWPMMARGYAAMWYFYRHKQNRIPYPDYRPMQEIDDLIQITFPPGARVRGKLYVAAMEVQNIEPGAGQPPAFEVF